MFFQRSLPVYVALLGSLFASPVYAEPQVRVGVGGLLGFFGGLVFVFPAIGLLLAVVLNLLLWLWRSLPKNVNGSMRLTSMGVLFFGSAFFSYFSKEVVTSLFVHITTWRLKDLVFLVIAFGFFAALIQASYLLYKALDEVAG